MQCTKFMIDNPEWWPLAEAIQAKNIMTRQYGGSVFSTNTWLGHVIIAESDLRATPAAQIWAQVGPTPFFEDDNGILQLLKKHIPKTDAGSPEQLRLAELLALALREKARDSIPTRR